MGAMTASPDLQASPWLSTAAGRLRTQGVVEIPTLLEALGIPADERNEARDMLEIAGLTRAGKTAMHRSKLAAADLVMEELYDRRCAACAELFPDERQFLEQTPEDCPDCRGSNNSRALADMVASCRAAGVHHLVIVGGSPSVRQALLGHIGDDLELRLVDNDTSAGIRRARSNLDWADVVVIMGSSELSHKLSLVYTQEPAYRAKVITNPRRGLAALAETVMSHLASR